MNLCGFDHMNVLRTVVVKHEVVSLLPAPHSVVFFSQA